MSGSEVISVRVKELAQLFNSLDPSPFHERDLDDDAEEYIVGSANELPGDVPITIVVHLPLAEAEKANERDLPKAFSNYFEYRAGILDRNLRELLRTGWRHLWVGLPLLVACLLASQLMRAFLGTGPLGRMIEESLILMGWVANWKPLEIFLYDWWPIRRQRNLYRRLASASVVIQTNAQ